MLNANLIYLVIAALVLFAALGVNALIDYRNQLTRQRRERLDWLSKQSSHTLNALAILKQTGCKAEIIEKIDQHAMSLIEEMIALSPKLDMPVPDSTAGAPAPQPAALNSDRAIRKAQIYIGFAEKLIMELGRGGRITMQLAHAYKQELYWLNVTVVADGHINQAKLLESNGRTLAALSHLKHAKAVMVRAMVSEELKRGRLDALQRDIDRLSVSNAPARRSVAPPQA